MTAILAIDYFYQIIVIADSRATWLFPQTNKSKPQDNLQKVYPYGPSGIIGFAGGIAAAKAVLIYIKKESENIHIPKSTLDIAHLIGGWAKESYLKIPSSDQIDLELMYTAVDLENVSLRTTNATFARNYLVKYISPNFNPEFQTDFVGLGYAKNYPRDIIRENRDGMLEFGLGPLGKKFQVGITVGSYGEELVKISNSLVGGLFSVGVVNTDGVNWYSYSIGDSVKLQIENGKFVQYDLKDGRRIPLKTIWDFDARRPEAGKLAFEIRPHI
jgi:hypothetical protein